MAGGRPTKYRVEYIEEVDEYIKSCVDTKEEVLNKIEITVNLPKIEDFAIWRDVDKTTLYEWSSKYPEFSHSLAKILRIQKSRLMNEGLAGRYNPTIAKLVLSSNHGMSEKTEIDHTTQGKALYRTHEEEIAINKAQVEAARAYDETRVKQLTKRKKTKKTKKK